MKPDETESRADPMTPDERAAFEASFKRHEEALRRLAEL